VDTAGYEPDASPDIEKDSDADDSKLDELLLPEPLPEPLPLLKASSNCDSNMVDWNDELQAMLNDPPSVELPEEPNPEPEPENWQLDSSKSSSSLPYSANRSSM
jgi:hypothetical protein